MCLHPHRSRHLARWRCEGLEPPTGLHHLRRCCRQTVWLLGELKRVVSCPLKPVSNEPNPCVRHPEVAKPVGPRGASRQNFFRKCSRQGGWLGYGGALGALILPELPNATSPVEWRRFWCATGCRASELRNNSVFLCISQDFLINRIGRHRLLPNGEERFLEDKEGRGGCTQCRRGMAIHLRWVDGSL